MSSADTVTTASATARATRSIIKGTAARMGGKSRGPDQQVRRDSFDVDDKRAQVFSGIEGGSRAHGLAWIDTLVRTAAEYDVVHKVKGEQGPLLASGVRVLEALLRNHLDFQTGRLDPAIARLKQLTRYSRQTIVSALARLRKHGFLDWIRRSRRTGNARGEGPQRQQATNAYFFRLRECLPKGVWQRFRDLLDRRRRAIDGRSAAADVAPLAAPAALVRDATLASALAELGAAVESASL